MDRRLQGVGVLLAATVLFSGTGCHSLFRGTRTASAPKPRPAETVADPDPDLTDRQIMDIQSSMARSMEQRGDLKAARAAWSQLLDRHPENGQAAWRLAVVTDRLGHFEKSEPLYRQAVKSEPRNVELLCDYGYSLYLQQRWAESARLLERAAELEPENPRVQNNLGLLYACTDRIQAAAMAFQRAGCTPEESRSNLGLAAAMNGRTADARRIFERVLQENPECTTAAQGLEALAAVERDEQAQTQDVRPASYSTR
ncbi:MAG: tetratricopeptide repeat protein [Planctomycetota bacterium]